MSELAQLLEQYDDVEIATALILGVREDGVSDAIRAQREAE